jgi:hypothetical protein
LGVSSKGFAVALPKSRHTFINSTPFQVDFKVVYASEACSNESFYLPPYTEKKISVGWCNLSSVEATVRQEYTGGTQLVGINKTENVKADDYKGPYWGTSQWVVYGPINGKYFVRRAVG